MCVHVIGRQLCDGRNGKKKRCLQRMIAKLKALHVLVPKYITKLQYSKENDTGKQTDLQISGAG